MCWQSSVDIICPPNTSRSYSRLSFLPPRCPLSASSGGAGIGTPTRDKKRSAGSATEDRAAAFRLTPKTLQYLTKSELIHDQAMTLFLGEQVRDEMQSSAAVQLQRKLHGVQRQTGNRSGARCGPLPLTIAKAILISFSQSRLAKFRRFHRPRRSLLLSFTNIVRSSCAGRKQYVDSQVLPCLVSNMTRAYYPPYAG